MLIRGKPENCSITLMNRIDNAAGQERMPITTAISDMITTVFPAPHSIQL
jgi:hypothetical protein